MNLRFLYGAIFTTALVLGVVFVLNKFPVTRGIVQAAIR